MKQWEKDEKIKQNYAERFAKEVSYIFSDGYKAGYEVAKEEVKRLRSECIREYESDEKKREYEEECQDHEFYGWCNQCHHPHGGRWAHLWEYCPWCGAIINHKEAIQTGGEK